MIGIWGPTVSLRIRPAAHDLEKRGRPLRPPVSPASGWPGILSRDTVVLVAMIPATGTEAAAVALLRSSASLKSGDSFTSRVTRRECRLSNTRDSSRIPDRRGTRWSTSWSDRRPAVLGDDTLTVT